MGMNKKVTALLLCMVMIMTSACQDTGNETTSALETDPAETAETTSESTEETTEETTAELTPGIELSGNPDDIIPIDQSTYYEGDNYILYFERGAEIHGDIAVQIESIMNDLESFYGMSFDFREYAEPVSWKTDYGFAHLGRVNEDCSKIDIIISKDYQDGRIEWSLPNVVMLFDTDLVPSVQDHGIVYHELTHILRTRQSPMLGKILEEGLACYSQDHFTRAGGESNWTMIQYVDSGNFSSSFDDSVIVNDPEGFFREANVGGRSGEQPEYHYGFRFVTFLIDTYGVGIVDTLNKNARGRDFSEEDNDTIIEIIKESTSDDVFERFATWLPDGWRNWSDSYISYMQSLGLL